MNKSQIVDELMRRAGCKNQSEFARYLSDKYDMEINRVQLYQFGQRNSMSLPNLLLIEAMNEGGGIETE